MKFRISLLMFLLTFTLGEAVGSGDTTSSSAVREERAAIRSSRQMATGEEGWEYTSFRELRLDPVRFEQLKAAIQDGLFRKVDSLIVVKGGKILIEEYFNGYDQDKLHEIRSATKSIGSAMMGIMIDQGYFAGVQDELFASFPDLEPFQNWEERKNDITLKNVLTMTTGLDCDDMDSESPGNESNVNQADDIVRFMLDLPMVHNPGEHWAYSTGCAHLVGALIERRTGLSVQEFAETNLFEPLGISQYQWKTSGGIAHTGGGFRVRPLDMAKFGQLYLNKGCWQGRQIVSETWIDESTRTHMQVTNDLGYGYLWWSWMFDVDGRPLGAFSAQGNGENHIFVFPDLDLVVVLTGGAYDEVYGPAQTAMMMSQYILPAVVQDVDSHSGRPHLREVPTALFMLCFLVIVSALIIWPVGFVVRKIRERRMKKRGGHKTNRGPLAARWLAAASGFISLVFLAAFLADILPFNLLLNSGMSHPLAVFEVFLGTKVLTVVALIVWIFALLAMGQWVFTALAHRNKWWRGWQRWHFTALTLASCYVAIVLLWWRFGKMPL
jgi:CubicO group peptidase (beta-lactamase class C family)